MAALLNFTLELTGILVPDDRTGQFSAFFAEFPEAIACGDTVEEAQKNLYSLIQVMLQDRREEVMSSYIDHHKYFTKPVNMVMA
ncbi:MAG: type II toxin-antitoxin system HicB family antitoxin [Chitinophagaceae bacterium]|nr:type II toxin-antitoxin system HicB family antitoxin [Chitinophagaceae bacterium]